MGLRLRPQSRLWDRSFVRSPGRDCFSSADECNSQRQKWRIDFSRVEWQFELVDGKYKKVPDAKEDNWVWSPQGIVDMHRPERWGFVQFSNALPGTAKFIPDSSLAGLDLLMEIYHSQRAFHKKHGKWAKSFSELDFVAQAGIGAEKFTMCTTADAYQASLVVSTDEKAKELWNVRQDSNIWMSKESEGL